MKKNAFLLAALGVVAFAGVNTAQAQSCAAPVRMQIDGGGNHTATGDTCAGANQLGTYCSGLANSPENDIIYAYTIDATRSATSITLATSTPAFNPALAIVTTCSGSATCVGDADIGGAGASETVVFPQAVGNYFLIVSASPESSTCGAFTLTANGRLPVSLQNFSVE